MSSSNIFIIIPVYNEAAVIAQTIHQVLQTGYNVVVVDDGSTDGTAAIIKKFPVHCIFHPVNIGQGAALQTGMDFARMRDAAVVVHFDADGQHKASDIAHLLEPVLSGECDVAFGSRFLKKEKTTIPFSRKLFLRIARYINWVLTGILLSDAHNGLRAMNRRALEAIYITENRMAHASEILWLIRRRGLKYKEVPVTIEYTAYSIQKGQSLWNSINIIFDILFKKINR